MGPRSPRRRRRRRVPPPRAATPVCRPCTALPALLRADPGTRPGLHGQTLVSSGHADLDRLLGGGLPLGSLLLLLEDGWSGHHATLLRYFLAEGSACGQVCDRGGSAQSINVPVPANSAFSEWRTSGRSIQPPLTLPPWCRRLSPAWPAGGAAGGSPATAWRPGKVCAGAAEGWPVCSRQGR